MKSYYYLDYLHREINLEEEDIQAIPESGRADETCAAIAEKLYVQQQFQADSFKVLKDTVCRLCGSPTIHSRHDALMYIVWIAALDIKERRNMRHTKADIKITSDDGFVWLLVPAEKARKLWQTEVFSLYRLYSDDSEVAIETEQDLEDTLSKGYRIGIEIGFISTMEYVGRLLK